MYINASTGEWFVTDPVGLGGVLALAFLVVLDIFLIVPLEPDDLGVALEGENVSRDSIEEPAIVRDDHRAAREGHQCILERAQSLDIQIVGGLIEQQDVA